MLVTTDNKITLKSVMCSDQQQPCPGKAIKGPGA